MFEYEKKLEWEELLHDLWFEKKMDSKTLTNLKKQYKPLVFRNIQSKFQEKAKEWDNFKQKEQREQIDHVEVGRLAFINHGKEYGKIVVIVEIVD